MASYNPNISNGTCYFAENTVTKGRFVPCGNDAIQVWPCCQLGSYCLSLGDANACWDPNSGNTYVAGCTDPSFVSPNCLRKPRRFHEQEWVAINQACKNLNANSASDGITNWTGCVVDNNSTELVKLPLASCTPYCSASDVLYVGSSSLAAYASLQTLPSTSIFWLGDYVPPTTPAPGYTPGTPTGLPATFKPTSSSSSSSGGGGGLSTGAKAGIGVGAAVGGILLLAALAGFLVTWSRRRKLQQRQQQQQQGFEPSSGGIPPSTTPGYSNHGGYNQYSQDMTIYPPSSGGYPSPPLPYSNAYYHHELGSQSGYDAQPQTHQGAAYMGYKSELPADEVPGSGYNPNLGTQLGPEQSKTPLSAASTMLPSSPQSGMPRHNSTGGEISPRYTDQ